MGSDGWELRRQARHLCLKPRKTTLPVPEEDDPVPILCNEWYADLGSCATYRAQMARKDVRSPSSSKVTCHLVQRDTTERAPKPRSRHPKLIYEWLPARNHRWPPWRRGRRHHGGTTLEPELRCQAPDQTWTLCAELSAAHTEPSSIALVAFFFFNATELCKRRTDLIVSGWMGL